MKKIFVIFIFLVIMSSCFSKNQESQEQKVYGVDNNTLTWWWEGLPFLETWVR